MTLFRVFIPLFVVTGSLLAQATAQRQSRPAAAESAPPATPAPQTTPTTQPPIAGAGAVSRENAPAADKAQPPIKEVPESAAVITIKGVCSSPVANTAATTARASSKSAECKTVITRAQWEHVLAVIGRPLPAQFRRQAAEQYANLLGMAAAAQKEGLDRDPAVQERLEIQRMQALGSAYVESMRKKYSRVPDAEVDKYYDDHKSQYESVTAKRIYVPKGGAAEDKKMDDAAVKALAQKIRDRAAAGEDFDKLQKEAFEQTGNKGTPPAIDIGEKRRGGLPPQQEEQVFKLKPSEVSQAYEEPSGFFIYKVEKTGTAPLEQVKPEIQRVIESEKMREAMDKLKTSLTPTLNETYFGPATPPVGTAPTANGTPPTGGAGAPQKPATAGSSQPTGQPTAQPSPPPK